VDEMEIQVKEAQDQLARARNGGSAADQQAAMKHLDQIQAAQSDRIKEITARAQAQIDAFRQLKGVNP